MSNPPWKGSSKQTHQRHVKPGLIDRVLDYSIEKMFGLKGRLVIVIGLVVKLVVGINTVTLDPIMCKLAGINNVYRVFHNDRILAKTLYNFNKLMTEKQTLIYQVNSGRSPYEASTDGNVHNEHKINKNIYFWKPFLANLKKKCLAIAFCLGKLPNYDFE